MINIESHFLREVKDKAIEDKDEVELKEMKRESALKLKFTEEDKN